MSKDANGGGAAGGGSPGSPSPRDVDWDDLLPDVHRLLRTRPSEFAEAGTWLDHEYSEKAVRKRRQDAEKPPASPSNPVGGSAARLPKPKRRKAPIPVRASAAQIPGVKKGQDAGLWRLSCAALDLRQQPPNLGVRSLDDRQTWARRVLLVVGLLSDAHAAEYAAPLTELARIPWDHSEAASLGRGWYADDAIDEGGELWYSLVLSAYRIVMSKVSTSTPEQWMEAAARLPGQVRALAAAFDRFHKTLDAATVPAAGGGRRIDGIAHGIAMSEATTALHRDLVATYFILLAQYGTAQISLPPGIAFVESDHPDGPRRPIPADEIQGMVMSIGGAGADALLMAATESAGRIVAFPNTKWNEMQAARPGAPHQRWHAGEVVTEEDLEVLESAAKLLRLHIDTPRVPKAGIASDFTVAEAKQPGDAPGPEAAPEAAPTPAAKLRAALFTLGRDLKLDQGYFAALVADHVAERVRWVAQATKILNSGDQMQHAALLKVVGVDSLDGADLHRVLYNPLTPERRPGVFASIGLVEATGNDALVALTAGGAAALERASASTMTPAILGADLREMRRLIEEFRSVLQRPVPLPEETPAKLVALGERFARAADILVSESEVSAVEITVTSALGQPGGPAALPAVVVGGKKAKSKPVGGRKKRRISDSVRVFLTGEHPYEGTKSELARAAGYTQPAALKNIKNFDHLWSENERRLAELRAARQRKMTKNGS